MSKILKSFAFLTVVGDLAVSMSAAVEAAPARTIDPTSLTPQQRAEFYRAPLGNTGPFGEPASTGCMWSRLQIPTAQGLRWVAIEECGSEGF